MSTISPKFTVTISAVKPDALGVELLPAMSASVVAWSEQEKDDDENSFLLQDTATTDSDDEEQDDKADIADDEDSESDESDDEGDDEDEEPLMGLALTMTPTVEMIAEYMKYMESDEVYDDLIVTVAYTDAEGKQLFAHHYRCDPNFEIDHTSGHVENDLSLVLVLDCYDSDKFSSSPTYA